MNKPVVWPLLMTVVLLGPCCGKKGPIYPPFERIPAKVSAFEGFQRGGALYLQWQNPQTYVDGGAMDFVAAVEIWVFEEEKQPLEELATPSTLEFVSKARIFRELTAEEFESFRSEKETVPAELEVRYPLKIEEIETRRFTFALKIRDGRGKYSDISHLVILEPSMTLLPPTELKADVEEEWIVLTWMPPEKLIDGTAVEEVHGYSVYRVTEDRAPVSLGSGLIKDPTYRARFEFGTSYRFYVRAAARDSQPYLESDDSNHIEVLPLDTFPPRAPSGLVAFASQDFVTLNWDPNSEQDLAGYKVMRKQSGDDEFGILTTDLIEDHSFIDRDVSSGKEYIYVVLAYDQAGNASPLSKSVSVLVGGENHEDISVQTRE